MADEGEIDVLGDFDLKLEADGNLDDNELPSKSANLLPEYTDPPWMLEQGWTLDNSCMDEKSKATIEKMLLEEQYYVSGKSPRIKKPVPAHVNHSKWLDKMPVGVGPSRKKGEQRKLVWTKEEKDMFHRGMEIYGRSWTKIAELIPTRTSTQIKNFAHQLFRSLNKDGKDNNVPPSTTGNDVSASSLSNSMINDQHPLSVTMETVSTASPTVKSIKKFVPKRGRIPAKDKLALQTLSVKKYANDLNSEGKSSVKNTHKQKVKGQGRGDVKGKCKDTLLNQVNRANSDRHLSDLVLDNKFTITPTLIENLDGFCAVTDIINGEIIENGKSDASDEDVNVDIENDDDDNESNSLLIGRSTSPNSVYEKLITEANILDNDGASRVDDSEEEIDKLEGSGNFLEWKTLESQQIKKEVVNVNSEQEIKTKESEDSLSVRSVVKCVEENNTEKYENNNDSNNEESLESKNFHDEKSQPKLEIYKQIDSQKVLVNAVCREDGEVVHFSLPTSEVSLEPKVITEQEKEVLKEFFENRPSKTPERYLKIRNFITESWKKCCPTYLNKTSVRSGLKNCGDVNSIGRVHAYLECIGAINYGCEQVAYKQPRSVYSLLGKEKVNKDFPLEVNSAKLEAMRPRKRKVKDAFGVWIDEKDLEGMTFEHGKLDENGPAKESKPKQTKTAYDPFKLIPCLSFSEEMAAPFLVEIHCSALIIMDIHSHISKTEVIGMLGGKFCDEQGKLTITMATPCNSISTGMQCEMDPVSQTQASEEIRGTGMEVVGWYHSHPSFAPNPSVRDIETQLKFQNWFSKGGSNFVGVIISPYNPRNSMVCSEVNCLTVSKEVLPQLQCNIPYKFSYTTKPCDVSEVNHIMLTAQDLATSYSNYQNRVDLVSTYSSSRGISCLDKMLESLKTYYPGEDNQQLLVTIRKTFTPVVRPDHIDNSSSKCDQSESSH